MFSSIVRKYLMKFHDRSRFVFLLTKLILKLFEKKLLSIINIVLKIQICELVLYEIIEKIAK